MSASGDRRQARVGLVGRPLVAGSLVVAALAGGATGCGRSAGALDAKAVYDRTVSAKTAQTAVNVRINAPRAGTYITAQGGVDLTAPYFAIAVQEAGITLNELLRGDQLYLEVPAAARAANAGKPWAEFKLRSDHGARVGTAAGTKTGTGPALAGPIATGSVLMAVDPAPALGVLQLAPTGVTLLGPRRLDGETTTEYRLYYETRELASTSPGDVLRAGLVSLLAQISHPRPAELPIYVWIDHEARLVELALSVVLRTEPLSPSPAQAALANQLPTTLSVNVYLGHFGEPLRLVPPAAARTKLLPLSQLEGGTL